MKINIDKDTIELIKQELKAKGEDLPYSQKDYDDLIGDIVHVGLNLYLETL
jgi:hypothetical protein